MNEFKSIKVSELHPFPDNPFKVPDNVEMEMLIESVKEYGIITPLLVRPLDTGGYEIISGHRRKAACEKAGIEKVPAFVRSMEREAAIVALVDSNLHREHILPSEKAFAYKMKLEAIKQQGFRSDLTSDQLGPKFRSNEMLAETVPDSKTQIQRYIRLTNLDKPLLDLVDEGRISLTPAVELSYLSTGEQNDLIATIESEECTPSLSQAVRMRKLSADGNLDMDRIFEIMTEIKGNQKEYLKLPSERYDHYLSRFQTTQQKEDFIMKALDHYTKYLNRQRSDDDAR